MTKEFIYLFETHDNGYGGVQYTYFKSDSQITQDICNKFINQVSPGCRRIGSNFDDFKEGSEINNIKIEKLPGYYELSKITNVLKNITGNY